MLNRHRTMRPRTPHWAEALEPRRLLSSTVVPLGGGQELIHDAARGLLYVPVGTSVQRFDVASRSLLAPIAGVGTALRGGDITPDGSRLYFADFVYAPGSPNPDLGTTLVRKVDLAGGTVSSIPISGAAPYHWMSHGHDLGIAANGQALLTIADDSDMYVQLDTSNDTYRYRTDWGGFGFTRPGTRVSRSADGQFMMLMETSNSGGSIFSYRSATDSFLPPQQSNTTNGDIQAISDDASRIAIQAARNADYVYVLNASWQSLATLSGQYVAAAFPPAGQGDKVYLADARTSELVAFDLAGAMPRELFRIKAGAAFAAPLGSFRSMRVSPDGRQVWMLDQANMQVFDLPQADPNVAASFKIEGASPFSPAGYRQSLKVTAYDAAGNVATGYRGAVRIRSTDARADLPADHTFTAADNGSHTFTFAQHTPGTHTVGVADLSGGVAAAKANVQTHNGNVTSIPLGSTFIGRKIVWNDAAGMVFVAGDSEVRAYDPRSQVVLPPVTVAQTLNGFDVSPDGRTVYAAEGALSGAFGRATFRKVDLATGAITNLRTDVPSVASDVAVLNNGRAIGTLGDGGTTNPLAVIDLATNAVTRGPTGYGGSLTKSHDGSAALGWGFSGPMFVYDAATNTVPHNSGSLGGTGYGGAQATINRDGSVLAFRKSFNTHVMDRSFTTTLKTVNGTSYAMAFNPAPGRDEFYLADESTDRVSVYDTATWAVKSSFPIGSDVRLHSRTAVSGDGNLLFMQHGTAGVEIYPLATRPVIAAPADTASFPAGTTRTITVNATKPDGTVDAAYRGTVRFTSSDAAAGLPADYTFTAADNGTRTFNVVFNTAGRQTVAVADVAAGSMPSTAERWVSGASLKPDGTLSVLGTTNRDVVAISKAGGNTTVDVTFGGVGSSFPFPAASVRKLTIDTLGGDDSVTVGDGLPGGWVDLDAGTDDFRAGSAAGAAGGATSGWSVAGGDGVDTVTLDAGAGPLRFLADSIANPTTAANRVVVTGTGGHDHLASSGAAFPLHVSNPNAFPEPRKSLTVSRVATAAGGGTGIDVDLAMVGVLTFNGGAGNDALDLARLPLDGPTSVTFNGEAGDDSMTGLAGPGGVTTAKGVTSATFNGGDGAGDALAWTFTDADKTFTVDSGRTTEGTASVNYSSTVESLTLDGGGGSDTFNLTTLSAAVVPLIKGGAGNDRANVLITLTPGTALRFDGGAGADTVSLAVNSAPSVTVGADRATDVNRTVYDRNVEAIELVGSANADRFAVTPRVGTTVSVTGNAPTTSSGDALTVNIAGAANPQQVVTGTGSGQFTFADRATVSYAGIESVATTSPAPPAWLAPGSAATWDPVAQWLTVTGAATIVADPGADAPVVTAAGAAAVVSVNTPAGGPVNLGGVLLSGNARLNVSPTGAARTIVVGNGESFTLDASATLDLTDNALAIRNTSQAAALAEHASVNNLVGNAFAEFAWDRPGITSSTAAADVAGGTPSTLGILLNNDGAGNPLFYGTGTANPTFMGAAVDANTVMIRFTRLGDGDLNGTVDTVDFALFQAGYTDAAPYVGFAFGDYDYNGVVDTVDFGLFQAGYQAGFSSAAVEDEEEKLQVAGSSLAN